jgi:Tfp pilus assembly protein PilF
MRSPFLAAAAGALLLAAPAPALPAGIRCSARGGDEWSEYRSKHFLLDTDLSVARAAALVAELETMQALELQALAGEQVEIPGRVRVVALSDPAQFRSMAGGYQWGAYYVVSPSGEPTIVIPASPGQGSRAHELVAHELAHHLSWYLFPRQPTWFAEGLAHFVETLGSAPATRSAPLGSHIQRGERAQGRAIGRAPAWMQEQLTSARPVPPRELLAWQGGESESDPGRFHLWSWLLFHWLWNARSRDLSAFEQRLSAGEAPAAAWRASFPDLDPEKPEAMARLEDQLDRYRRDGRYVFATVSASADTAHSRAPLGPADVHLLLLDARSAWPQGKEREELVRAELEEALREDPSQPRAIAWRAQLTGESPVPALQKAVAARPGDAGAWFALGAALGEDPAGREAAYRKAVALNPDHALAHNNLAWALARAGRMKEALPEANRAADLSPWSPAILDTLAYVAAGLGKCPEALVLQRRAVELLPGREGPELREHLAAYERRCGAPARAPP